MTNGEDLSKFVRTADRDNDQVFQSIRKDSERTVNLLGQAIDRLTEVKENNQQLKNENLSLRDEYGKADCQLRTATETAEAERWYLETLSDIRESVESVKRYCSELESLYTNLFTKRGNMRQNSQNPKNLETRISQQVVEILGVSQKDKQVPFVRAVDKAYKGEYDPSISCEGIYAPDRIIEFFVLAAAFYAGKDGKEVEKSEKFQEELERMESRLNS